ncbi:RusA family crossover junction endodeoxyribonuclease [Parvularcula sp. LCG005]|uniref:RusA family crossover junction endodeoxyribonuclease n=1 Tax=Parvularcula sp. LCG005 TaxID=3078805 RepID=UPI002942BAAE|nr:RusA family crossover junction endodeoxyribonuclease [Parvularcula sp. LCG005]WOI54603.1 RusA family crossover junction endodeoxyribonuclease [Parvularcula sp. LCG005]
MGTGRGRVSVKLKGDDALITINAATTQTRILKKLIANLIRAETHKVRPAYTPFEVRIWTSVLADKRGYHDVDNVAKAVLDALSGIFWQDDRQVQRLISERFEGDANRIVVRVRPLNGPVEPVEFDDGLFDA